MKINKLLLQKLGQLAQLEIGSDNEAVLLKDLNETVTWIAKLKDLDTTGIDPLVTMASEYNVLQEDISQAPLGHAKGMTNAPSKDANYFRVPQVKE